MTATKCGRTGPLCHISLILALQPLQVDAAKRREGSKSKRRRRTPVAAFPRLGTASSNETLRDRWVDILSLEHDEKSSIRLETRREAQYYYESEILVDKLLGTHPGDSIHYSSPEPISLTKELLSVWKSVALILIGIPLLAALGAVLTSPMVQTMLSSMQSSITPYLVPSLSAIRSSARNAILQGQALWHSKSYLLRHLNRIRVNPGPFLYKLLRKCIILEAWRHIWVRVYKLTRYMWRGTLSRGRQTYVRFCPAWIRRGIKSMFHSMVQAHVGGMLGSALSGVTFESWADWSSSGVSGSESFDASAQEVLSDDAISESMLSDAAIGHSLVDTIQSASEVAEDAADTIAESVGDAVAESAADVIGESMVEEVVESLTTSVESSIEDAVECLVGDCLTDG
ncbi:hypothetical protein ACHAWF_003289 [Thalassiosira exigua]